MLCKTALSAATLASILPSTLAFPRVFITPGENIFERGLRQLQGRQLRPRASAGPSPVTETTISLAADFTTCPEPTLVIESQLTYGPGSYGPAPNTQTTLSCTYQSTDPAFDELVCEYDAKTGAPSQYNQPACPTGPSTAVTETDSRICLTSCVGQLVNSVTIDLQAFKRIATTSCYVGGVGECIFEARSGNLQQTAGPLDCSRVSVAQGQCVADYVGMQ